MIFAESQKILIAEDVESNFLYLSAVLSKIDAEIIWAKNGLEVVQKFKEHDDIDLVLMDLQMPEMNGFEATKIIKQLSPNMPVIAQTAFAMAEDRQRALAAGCDEYIAKPIRSAELIDLVEKYHFARIA